MRRYLVVAMVGIMALCLSLAAGRMTMPGAAARANDVSPPAPGLEMKVAGGWFLYVYESETPAEVLAAVDGDGSMVINDTTRADGKFNCTGVGSWEMVGPREVASTVLVFVKDFEGNLAFYEKASGVMTLSDDRNTMEGVAEISFYLPGQNPLDPEEVPIGPFAIPEVWQRIFVE
jgi:hypothetical protein